MVAKTWLWGFEAKVALAKMAPAAGRLGCEALKVQEKNMSRRVARGACSIRAAAEISTHTHTQVHISAISYMRDEQEHECICSANNVVISLSVGAYDLIYACVKIKFTRSGFAVQACRFSHHEQKYVRHDSGCFTRDILPAVPFASSVSRHTLRETVATRGTALKPASCSAAGARARGAPVHREAEVYQLDLGSRAASPRKHGGRSR